MNKIGKKSIILKKLILKQKSFLVIFFQNFLTILKILFSKKKLVTFIVRRTHPKFIIFTFIFKKSVKIFTKS